MKTVSSMSSCRTCTSAAKRFASPPSIPTAGRKSCSTCRGTTSTGRTSIAWPSPSCLPAGTRIDCHAAFDNSENNLLNPDPTSEVHWGDQTWDEMMVGSYDYSPAEQDFALGPPRVTRADDGRYDVAFRYRPPQPAKAVYLAGTFNEWKPTALAHGGPRQGRLVHDDAAASRWAGTNTSS